jgi:Zn-finger domain-containing protein
MTKQIKSKIIIIERLQTITTAKIEEILAAKFGKIVRWAIIDCIEESLKLSVTYLV